MYKSYQVTTTHKGYGFESVSKNFNTKWISRSTTHSKSWNVIQIK